MSSLETIHQDSGVQRESSSLAGLPSEPVRLEPARQVSREVAHELNNILTVIQGYAQRLLLDHAADPELRSDLQIICDSTRRAALVVRQATPPRKSPLLPTRVAT